MSDGLSIGHLLGSRTGEISRKDYVIGLAILIVLAFLINFVLAAFWGIGYAALITIDFSAGSLIDTGAALHKAYWFNCWPIILFMTPLFFNLCLKRFRSFFGARPKIALFITLSFFAAPFIISAITLIRDDTGTQAVAFLFHIITLFDTILLSILPVKFIQK